MRQSSGSFHEPASALSLVVPSSPASTHQPTSALEPSSMMDLEAMGHEPRGENPCCGGPHLHHLG